MQELLDAAQPLVQEPGQAYELAQPVLDDPGAAYRAAEQAAHDYATDFLDRYDAGTVIGHEHAYGGVEAVYGDAGTSGATPTDTPDAPGSDPGAERLPWLAGWAAVFWLYFMEDE